MPRRHPCFAPPPAPLGLRFRALLGLGFVPPPEPRPCVHCASIAYALLPSSASLYVATEQIQNRRLGRCHREVPPASPLSRPSRAAARIAPTVRRHPHRAPSLSSRCGGPRALTGKNRTVCIPFSPNARKRPPSWQHPPEMYAFRDQNGNILASCIHFRVQSGDSGYMARESCRQGPFFASRSPKSRMARRCCQRRPAFPRQRHAVRPNGLCALRRGPGLLAACAPPCRLACARRGLRLPAISPAFIAAVLYASRFATRIAPTVRRHSPHRPLRSGRAVDQALPAALVLPTPRQPSPGPEPTESRPPVEPSAPIRAPPPVASRPAAWVPLRFR